VEAFLVDPCIVAIPSPSSELEVTGFDFNSALRFAGNGGGRPGGVGRWWCDGRIHLFFFILVSVGGLEGDSNGVGG
jgi:hypothetical protein